MMTISQWTAGISASALDPVLRHGHRTSATNSKILGRKHSGPTLQVLELMGKSKGNGYPES